MVRAFVLERPQGNVIVYNAPGISEAADEICEMGRPERLLMNHHHEAMHDALRLDVPVWINEADRANVDMATAGTFSERDMIDDDLEIIPTPGHTPGHSSLQLMMPESGPVLLTGDLYHRKESRELKRVPRFNFDEAETLASMDAFEARATRLGAKVIIQHEPDDIEPLNGEIR